MDEREPVILDLKTGANAVRYGLVLDALRYQVRRGHFHEMHEGFYDCPASAKVPDAQPRCICGLTEAAAALEALGVAVPEVGEWADVVSAMETERIAKEREEQT